MGKQLIELLDTNKKDRETFSSLEGRRKFQDNFNKELDLEEAAIRTRLIALKDPKMKEEKSRQLFQNSVINILDKYDSGECWIGSSNCAFTFI